MIAVDDLQLARLDHVHVACGVALLEQLLSRAERHHIGFVAEQSKKILGHFASLPAAAE
jgi:hypothetical protein